LNLLKNAEEAMAGPGRILIRVFRDKEAPGEVVIQVADTGPGVPDDIRDRLFDPFATTKGGENSGLGLSVCHGLIKAFNGDIRLIDMEGFGAAFEIRLPSA